MLGIEMTALESMPRRARISIVAVGVLVLLMVWLLYRTESNAAQVGRDTQRIAASGRGINENTDAIVQLNTTNQVAASILASLSSINTNLSGVNSAARSIADKSGSIRTSTTSIADSSHAIDGSQREIAEHVGAISTSVGQINTSLRGVNENAASILTAALSIQRGVALISSNLATTRIITNQILAEARDIGTHVKVTNHEAKCINNGLNGGPRC